MTRYILDASAFLAIIRDEIGAEIATERLRGASMSAVNASEALMRGVEKGTALALMRDLIATQNVRLISFDSRLAVETALLRSATKHLGLSFADRACIATAIQLGGTAVTADHAWASLDLPCPVELIR